MAAVDIWAGRLDCAAAEVERLKTILSLPEQARAGRFHFARDRRRFIVRRARLREVLGAAVGIAPQRLTFRVNAFGKPALVESALCFSATHSGEHWAVAVSNVEVGLDIETHKPGIDHRDIAHGLFAPMEVAALTALPDTAAERAFFDIWARKEAFVKALGEGLSYPLDAFTVSHGADARLTRGGEGWAITALSVAPDVSAALVARDDGEALTVTYRSFEQQRVAA
ncbi:4'-phosphopantetheinyl transferase family protein [Sphingomonas sp. GlSt437]|uniref:4'-phosphopantetheinyl transferase family protein n=1 Tax=Sphingomonas sp. GlSt437 TaxID=3389970 RepID=UPI003A89AC63